MSDRQNVITPVGKAAPQPRAQALHELARRRRAARGIGRQSEAERGLQLLGLRGLDAVPRRQHARRRRAAQQRERGGRKRIDVAGARRRPVGGELGRAIARRARAAARRVGSRGHAEVHELHAPTLGQDQVRRLDVAVDDRRVLRVQVRERLGRLGEVGEHARRRQTWSAPLAPAASRGRCPPPSPWPRRTARRRRSPPEPAEAPDAAEPRAECAPR